jgi:hypothetical protein
MKRLILTITAATLAATPAYAASETGEVGLLMWMFLGFGALIVVMQTIPGMILFGSMLKGMFSKSAKVTEDPATKHT